MTPVNLFDLLYRRRTYVTRFFCREQLGITLPEKGRYATGIFFMDKTHHADSEGLFEALAKECELKVGFIFVR